MINCPKCNELLGDNVRTCFRCKHQITETEYHEIMRAKDRMSNMAWNDMLEKYHRKKRRLLMVFAGLLLLVIALCICSFIFDWKYYVLISAVGSIWIGFIIFCIVSGSGKCPICDQSMGRVSILMTHCPRCGAKIH